MRASVLAMLSTTFSTFSSTVKLTVFFPLHSHGRSWLKRWAIWEEKARSPFVADCYALETDHLTLYLELPPQP